MSEKPDREDDLRGQLRASYEFHRWLEELAKVPYDGIVGWPPAWMPSPLVYEFKTIRARLLNDARTLWEFQAWKRILRVRKDMRCLSEATKQRQDLTGNARYWRQGFVPPELTRDLEALLYIQDLADLGDIEGLKAYLGEETLGGQLVLRGRAHSEHLKKAAKAPRPNRIAKRINAILAQQPGLSSKEVIKILRTTPSPDLDADLSRLSDRQLEQRISRCRS
jgi:hypothetical protein